MHVCLVVFGLVFQYLARKLSGKNVSEMIVCRVGRKTLNQSVNPSLRLIIDLSNVCNHAFAPVLCRCRDQSNLKLLGVLGLSGTFFPQLPLSLGISSPCRRRTVPRPLAACTKIDKNLACVVWEISSWTNTHTYTDVLITILRSH